MNRVINQDEGCCDDHTEQIKSEGSRGLVILQATTAETIHHKETAAAAKTGRFTPRAWSPNVGN